MRLQPPDRPTTLVAMPAAHHLEWLMQLTSIPTAAGKEERVIAWIESWCASREDVTLTKDGAGNLVLERTGSAGGGAGPPLFITAHLDHPAFVVERIVSPSVLGLTFRGGVLGPYFKDAPIVLHTRDGRRVRARIIETTAREPLRECLAELDHADDAVEIGDIGVWSMPDAIIEGDLLHAPACDDLAAVAAALSAFDALRNRVGGGDVRLLFTRAEEVGFIGAIAASKSRTMPEGSRVLALENSRSYAESPIGGGPIVRVGDRVSTFSPALTAAVAKTAEALAKERESSGERAFLWQRKLMAGGACEASAFCAYGYEATCICLPLGNYHNMAALDAVQSGDEDARASARCAREYISISDYRSMIDLLVACAVSLADAEPLAARMEKLYAERRFVLDS